MVRAVMESREKANCTQRPDGWRLKITYHGCIQEGIVEIRIGLEQLAAKICSIGHVCEEGDVGWVGVVMG